MENKVFPNLAVASELNKVIESRIHNDAPATQTEVRNWQVELVATLATPSYALVDPKTDELIARHEGPEMNATIFAEWLKGAIEKWEKAN